jgi:hypothetical protein
MTRPTWEQYSAHASNEECAAAIAALECDPFRVVLTDAARWLRYSPFRDGVYVDGTFCPDPYLDWDAWVSDVDQRGRGWSSTQWRLYAIAAGLATGREFNIVGVLDRLNEWTLPVLQVLVTWSTGGSAEKIRAATSR